MLCDGSAVSRSTYANLFTAIGTGWGSGDGATTFNLPDLRGRFLRGVDPNAMNDPDANARTAINPGGNTGAKVGTLETDVFANHDHTLNDPGHSHGVGAYDWDNGLVPGHWLGGSSQAPDMPNTTFWSQSLATAGSPTGITIAAAGGSETRPKNAAVTYIVKF
jgi:microcystin-dependent protein